MLMQSLRQVFEENLDKDTSDGSDLSGLTIKFVLATDSGESASVAQLQATDVVTQATEGMGASGPTSPTVGLITSAVDMTTHVVTEAQPFANTWNVLLERMELLNKIVAGIAQVYDNAGLDSLFLNGR